MSQVPIQSPQLVHILSSTVYENVGEATARELFETCSDLRHFPDGSISSARLSADSWITLKHWHFDGVLSQCMFRPLGSLDTFYYLWYPRDYCSAFEGSAMSVSPAWGALPQDHECEQTRVPVTLYYRKSFRPTRVASLRRMLTQWKQDLASPSAWHEGQARVLDSRVVFRSRTIHFELDLSQSNAMSWIWLVLTVLRESYGTDNQALSVHVSDPVERLPGILGHLIEGEEIAYLLE